MLLYRDIHLCGIAEGIMALLDPTLRRLYDLKVQILALVHYSLSWSLSDFCSMRH
jgi:uridine kinase